MISEKDKKEIVLLRGKKVSLRVLGEMYGVTGERIRQICFRQEYPLKFCEIHKKKYEKECYACSVRKDYQKKIVLLKDIVREAKKLRNKTRRKENVTKLRELIRIMTTTGLIPGQIAKLVGRDRTTIIYHQRWMQKKEK